MLQSEWPPRFILRAYKPHADAQKVIKRLLYGRRPTGVIVTQADPFSDSAALLQMAALPTAMC